MVITMERSCRFEVFWGILGLFVLDISVFLLLYE